MGDGIVTFDPGGFHSYVVRDAARQLITEYNLENLRSHLRVEDQDLREHIEDREKLIELIRMRIKTVEGTAFKDMVYLHRRKYGGDPVVYYAGVYHTPQAEGGDKHRVAFEARRFDGGPSKKEAFEYAEMLSKKYNCPIVKEGFGEGSR